MWYWYGMLIHFCLFVLVMGIIPYAWYIIDASRYYIKHGETDTHRAPKLIRDVLDWFYDDKHEDTWLPGYVFLVALLGTVAFPISIVVHVWWATVKYLRYVKVRNEKG
jgi:hypothetical protein|tara:strand:+ start:11172 stop:11495 length:324 start_codon:yes stop_codon:yes gene_type:complete